MSNDLEGIVNILIHGSQVDHNLFEINDPIILKIYLAKKLLKRPIGLLNQFTKRFLPNLVIFLLNHFNLSLLFVVIFSRADQVLSKSDRNINRSLLARREF